MSSPEHSTGSTVRFCWKWLYHTANKGTWLKYKIFTCHYFNMMEGNAGLIFWCSVNASLSIDYTGILQWIGLFNYYSHTKHRVPVELWKEFSCISEFCECSLNELTKVRRHLNMPAPSKGNMSIRRKRLNPEKRFNKKLEWSSVLTIFEITRGKNW